MLHAERDEIADDIDMLNELLYSDDQDEDDLEFPDDQQYHDGDPDEVDPPVESQVQNENIPPWASAPVYPPGSKVKPVAESVRVVTSEHIRMIKTISKRVGIGTAFAYEGVADRFVDYLVGEKFVTDGRDVFTNPHPDMHWFIIHYLNTECDTVDINGKPKPTSSVIKSWATAERIRAGLLYTFGTVHGRGKTPWRVNLSGSMQMQGNPVMCDPIGDYMISMRRRKAQAGETCRSSRAQTQTTTTKAATLSVGATSTNISNFTQSTLSLSIACFGRLTLSD
ncbi:hypothetical protein DFH09DRAFT_1346757 [Mycena vulgaris]|nr:hypothetical protein DFH09DRAFT_1346757 [Mycena vulgaris]